MALGSQQSGVQQAGPRSGSVAELSALNWSQLRARATSLGVARRDESQRLKTWNELEEECRLALEVQQSEMQQEARRSGSALDVGGSSFAWAQNRLRKRDSGGKRRRKAREAAREKRAAQLAQEWISLAQQSGVHQPGSRSGSVAELSALNWSELRSRATSLGVTVRIDSRRQKNTQPTQGRLSPCS